MLVSMEASNKGALFGECPVTPAGSPARGTWEERRQELGRPMHLPDATKELWAGRESQLHGGRPTDAWESDHFIVLLRRESRSHGEGNGRNAKLAKET